MGRSAEERARELVDDPPPTLDAIAAAIRTAQREAAAEALEEQARQAANAMECAREEGQSAYSKLWGYVAKKLSRRARQYREEAGRG